MHGTLTTYADRLRAFSPNARLYLLSVVLTGASMGVFRLLFNFYVLSLGYDEALLGQFITTTNLVALVMAFPLGFLGDLFGYKSALIARTLLMSVAIGGMALWPGVPTFFAMNALIGVVQGLSRVSRAPFLMQNSARQERTYLFSFASGLRMGSMFVGNWLGGYLPSWMGVLRGVENTAPAAYGGALLVMAFLTLIGLLPLVFIREVNGREAKAQNGLAPLKAIREQPRLLGRLLFPYLLISLGAGLFIPFMNVFFRVVHQQSDQVIGTLFAWGSLAMGVGLILAPPIADRLGKIQLVVLTQGLSIPFMAVLGFAPYFSLSAGAYFIRLVLMNMSNPIYDAFLMEQITPESRATVASLSSMVWSFGRTVSPTVSGWLQVQYGFAPVFGGAILFYTMAVLLYAVFFLRGDGGAGGGKGFKGTKGIEGGKGSKGARG